jgi:phenylpyruvate tautomerase PptA (4-oxalocrotonate tautomerase family)
VFLSPIRVAVQDPAVQLGAMPLLEVTSNLVLTEAEKMNCLQTLSKAAAELLEKPESVVMTAWHSAKMTFAGTDAGALHLSVQALRMPEDAPQRLTPELCERIQLTVGVSAERVFITYTDVPPTHWGWNHKTFG